MRAAGRFIENDVAESLSQDAPQKWTVLLQKIRDGDIKGIKDAFKVLMRLKQGVVSRIPSKCS